MSAHGPLAFEDMDERQLHGALGGAMAWQHIVQAQGGGPEECMEAARQTERILRIQRKREAAWAITSGPQVIPGLRVARTTPTR